MKLMDYMTNYNRIESFRGENRFLSNFWYAKTTYGGIEFPTSEHAYQSAKSIDERVRRLFLTYETPGEAKRQGALIECRPDWDLIKVDVMNAILFSKFSDNHLMEKLLATGDAELIEGNYHKDFFWGVCEGRGENWLGKLLMKLRAWETEFRELGKVVKVEMIKDFHLNGNGDEIITEGAIGTIKHGNTIYFPEGVKNLPEKVEPQYVHFDFNKDDWKGLVKII